jgi:DNA-binding phage protein
MIMGKREYKKLLNKIVDDIYDVWQGTYSELAAASGCCYATISRLGSYKTKKPQLATVLKLAKAVGIKLEFDFRGAKKLKVVA